MKRTITLLLTLLLINNINALADSNRSCKADTDSLTILVAASNWFYYYDNKLIVSEESNNFKVTTNSSVRILIADAENDAIKKGRTLLVILKFQNRKKLNAASKQIIAMIKKKYKYKTGKLSTQEVQLITITEQINEKNI